MPCQLAHPDRDLLLNRATQGPHTKRLLQHSRGRRSPPPLSRGVHPEVPEASDSTGSCVGTSGRCCAVWPSRARATWKKSICWSTPCPSGCRSRRKYSVAQVIEYIKGKSAIHIARHYAGRPRNFVGQHFWALRRYFVSTVGRDEQAIRTYIRDHYFTDA